MKRGDGRPVHPAAKEFTMNKHQVAGRAEQVKGKAKEAAGRATANDRMKAEGQVDQMAGKTRAKAGDTKERVKKSIDKI
jgi:uncharacterized protein YjbJ (UPF0337 family)